MRPCFVGRVTAVEKNIRWLVTVERFSRSALQRHKPITSLFTQKETEHDSLYEEPVADRIGPGNNTGRSCRSARLPRTISPILFVPPATNVLLPTPSVRAPTTSRATTTIRSTATAIATPAAAARHRGTRATAWYQSTNVHPNTAAQRFDGSAERDGHTRQCCPHGTGQQCSSKRLAGIEWRLEPTSAARLCARANPKQALPTNLVNPNRRHRGM